MSGFVEGLSSHRIAMHRTAEQCMAKHGMAEHRSATQRNAGNIFNEGAFRVAAQFQLINQPVSLAGFLLSKEHKWQSDS